MTFYDVDKFFFKCYHTLVETRKKNSMYVVENEKAKCV